MVCPKPTGRCPLCGNETFLPSSVGRPCRDLPYSREQEFEIFCGREHTWTKPRGSNFGNCPKCGESPVMYSPIECEGVIEKIE